MAKTVTNAQVDTLAAAVPSPYGPLTRITDFEALPVPNSAIRGSFTSALSVVVWFSAEELELPVLTLELNENAHSWTAIVIDMKAGITALDALADAMTTPHTYEDYVVLVEAIGDNLGRWSRGKTGPIT